MLAAPDDDLGGVGRPDEPDSAIHPGEEINSRPLLRIRIRSGDRTTAFVSKADGDRGPATKVSTEGDRSKVFVNRGQPGKNTGGDTGN